MRIHTGGVIGPRKSGNGMLPPGPVIITIFESRYYKNQLVFIGAVAEDGESWKPTFRIEVITNPARARNVRASSSQRIVPTTPAVKGTVAIKLP